MSIFSPLLGLAFFASEVLLAWRRRSTQTKTGREADRGSLALLWRVIACAIAAGVSLAACGVGPRLPAGVPWGIVGAVVFLAGAAVRWWAIWHLGRFFTVDVAVAADHRVVDDGPYRLVRHPSYSGLMLQFVGLGLALGDWLGCAVVIVPTFFALLYRIRVEESALHDGLGENYAQYVRRTKRLVPLVY